MHPALRKGPLFTKKPILHFFYKKNIPMFHFFTKPFSTFLQKNTPAIFHFFLEKNPAILFPAYGPVMSRLMINHKVV